MRRAFLLSIAVMLFAAASISADTFGTGANQFTIDFVPISGSTNPTSGYGIVNNNYRIGKLEITNDQWNKFKVASGPVTGSPSTAYDIEPQFTGTDVPTNNVSWYEAAQFVNWLNTSIGHQAAYKFTGTKGTSDYTFAPWGTTDAGFNASNPYRNSTAFYFLPTENEWVKAAYWNGTSLQIYATKAGESLTQGNGTSGIGWNYRIIQYATNPPSPWAVGSGSQELNGTYDMMGNVYEWMESPWTSGDYGNASSRALRGGSYYYGDIGNLTSSSRYAWLPENENFTVGFRVASVPEPASALILFAGAGFLKRRKV